MKNKPHEIATAIRIRIITPYGHLHMSVVVDPVTENELEVFAQIGKSAEPVACEMEALCRATSLYLRSGGKLADMAKQFAGIGSTFSTHSDFNGEREKTISIPNSFGKSLLAYCDIKKKYGIKKFLLGEIEHFDDIDVG